MTQILKNADILYTKPPMDGPGLRADFRSHELTTDDIVTTQLLGLGVLPAGRRLVGFALEVDDIDSATATTISVGVLNTYYGQAPATVAVPAAYASGGETNTGTEPELVTGQDIITSSALGQTGGRIEYSALQYGEAIGVDNARDRVIAIHFTAAATQVAGTIALTLLHDAA